LKRATTASCFQFTIHQVAPFLSMLSIIHIF
jgi:hypothetical protein